MKRALISVSDKTGIVELAQSLHARGVEIVSTGGTATTLRSAGVPVTDVSDVTGYPECLDGRVKTLHPAVHGGLLAVRSNPRHMEKLDELGIRPIDLIVINLYPFRQTIAKPGVTLEEAIENIDIGGPAMLRAAAKNWQDVVAIVDPADYGAVLQELERDGAVSRDTRFALACKVFEHTAAYDAMIAGYLDRQRGVTFPDTLTLTFEKQQDLRYGENPHQRAMFYRETGDLSGTLCAAHQLNGKELSYNNISDTNGALDLLREFDETCVIGVKHGNPCGVGVGETVFEAWQKAYRADPVSIFGGIVVTNGTLDKNTAAEINEIFIEIVVAPEYEEEALRVLKKKKNIRLLELPGLGRPMPAGTLDMKKVSGGLLVQEMDLALLADEGLRAVTRRAPTPSEMKDLLLAWKIVKHVKSNGIAIARDGQSLGVGPGQVNRIWATQQAIERAGERARGAALASDAFFPFDDCVKAAAGAGIAAIIQPGGSINDADSIAAADAAGIAMVFTGMRHFKHS